MANIGDKLSQPEVGWRRYDDSIGLIKYDGTWQSNMPNASSWMGTRHVSSNLPDKLVKFVFKGTKFRIIINSASNRSVNSTISIDGEIHTFSSRFTTTLTIAPSRLAFEKTDLPYGYHTVIISDTTTDYIDIDAIDIDEDGELVRHDYLDNLDVPELMRKYGFAWFDFNEESGSSYDKLNGNYVGNVISNTRVNGWNGKGYSLDFNGTSDYVDFNTKLPIGEKSIRFKIKTSQSANSIITFLTHNNDYVNYDGLNLGINTNNTLRVAFGKNKMLLSSSTVINDGKWHDVLLTWDGTTNSNSFKVYIDDFSTPNAQGTPSSLETVNPIYDMRLGATTTGVNSKPISLFKGQLDDLQIYSKALSPSELSQKYVSIKTLDNKIITLPNKQGRVKEILSADESDLINESYSWIDIDGAIDRDSIKLTQSTTEYEIVSKDNSSLGKGKIFTLPIDNFKTVKIEDNY